MQKSTPFAPDPLIYRHVEPTTAEQHGCSFESLGGSNAPNSVPNATPTPQTGSLSLVDEQISSPFMCLPVQFGDLAVSAMVDAGETHNFLTTSFLLKLQDSPSFLLLIPCQFQVKLADGGVV